MEIENIIKKNSIYKRFIYLLILMLVLVSLSIISLIIIIRGQNEYLLKSSLVIIITILSAIALLSLTIIVTAVLLWHEKPVAKFSKSLLEISLTIIYPIMLNLASLLKFNRNSIRGAFTELNNKLVFSNEYSIEASNILILTPHCIQKSFCQYKITTDIENCRRCGQCNVEELIRLQDEFGVNFRVVTGGTLARKIIRDLKPKAIVAIACERDLISGLQDIKKLPIIAVTNKRPEGPCVNTWVDIGEVKAAIEHFLSKE